MEETMIIIQLCRQIWNSYKYLVREITALTHTLDYVPSL